MIIYTMMKNLLTKILILVMKQLIAYMIIDNNTSLSNSNILILGYGHCGKDLALMDLMNDLMLRSRFLIAVITIMTERNH